MMNKYEVINEITECPQCGSGEIDIVVGRDTECRDCGFVGENYAVAEYCLSKKREFQTLIIEEKIDEN
jgi:predicted Zn-ribbon and HTH transcriptional regulator